jgi:hypothetical protein
MLDQRQNEQLRAALLQFPVDASHSNMFHSDILYGNRYECQAAARAALKNIPGMLRGEVLSDASRSR